MPVYRNHRIVHLHIPKTAGTSLEWAFAALGDRAMGAWFGHAVREGRHYEYQHLSALELRRLSGSSFENFHVFAVVRNPYDRLISAFEWQRDHAARGTDHVTGFESFEDFVAAVPGDVDHNWNRYIALADRRHANHLIHIRPQWQYLCDSAGNLDPRIEIVRFEHLHDDLAALFDRWRVDLRLPPWDRTAWRPADYYTPATFERVGHTYARDLEWFGYGTAADGAA